MGGSWSVRYPSITACRCLQQSVDEAQGGPGLARARGHGEQHVLRAGGDGRLDGLDGVPLEVSKGKVVRGLGLELGLSLGGVLREQIEEPLRRVPAFQRVGVVGRTSGVEEPDPALGLQLTKEGPPVRGEQEGHVVLAPWCPGGRGLEVYMPVCAAACWARTSPNWRSLKSAVMGSSKRNRSALAPCWASSGSAAARCPKFGDSEMPPMLGELSAIRPISVKQCQVGCNRSGFRRQRD